MRSTHGKFLNGDSINGQILTNFRQIKKNYTFKSRVCFFSFADTESSKYSLSRNCDVSEFFFFFFGGEGIYDHCSLFVLSFIFSLNQVKTCDTVLLSQSD